MSKNVIGQCLFTDDEVDDVGNTCLKGNIDIAEKLIQLLQDLPYSLERKFELKFDKIEKKSMVFPAHSVPINIDNDLEETPEQELQNKC